MHPVVLGLVIGVATYATYVALGGPYWRRRSTRALRRGDNAQARMAAMIMPVLPKGSSDREPRTQLDGALEILAIELERLLPMARDLDSIWWQVRAASMISARGWAQVLLDRYGRFERMTIETLGRAEVAGERLDSQSRARIEDRLGDLGKSMHTLRDKIRAQPSDEAGSSAVEAVRRPLPEQLLEALHIIGLMREALRIDERDPYR